MIVPGFKMSSVDIRALDLCCFCTSCISGIDRRLCNLWSKLEIVWKSHLLRNSRLDSNKVNSLTPGWIILERKKNHNGGFNNTELSSDLAFVFQKEGF